MKLTMLLTKKTALLVVLGAGSLAISGCASYNPFNGSNSNSNLSGYSANGEREYGIQRHAYAGLGVGASRMEPDTSEVAGVDVNDRVEPAGQITIGMDVTRRFAIEAHSADLGSAGLSPGGRINYHIYGASALLYAGENRGNFKRTGLSGYGRLGLGVLDNSTVGDVEFIQDNGVHVLFGAGVEYMTRIGLGLRAEAIAFEEDARYMQLGAVYRVGKRSSKPAVKITQAPPPARAPTPIPVPAVVIAKPAPVFVDTCSEFSGALEGVNFHSGSSELTSDAQGILDTVASRLSECSSVPVSISAHTDSQGAEAFNQDLSARRAKSVVMYLNRRGIDSQRMDSRAYGETQPIESNSTAEGRRSNRRVELITVQ